MGLRERIALLDLAFEGCDDQVDAALHGAGGAHDDDCTCHEHEPAAQVPRYDPARWGSDGLAGVRAGIGPSNAAFEASRRGWIAP